jgi:pentapeptide MXKDX repeat protein
MGAQSATRNNTLPIRAGAKPNSDRRCLSGKETVMNRLLIAIAAAFFLVAGAVPSFAEDNMGKDSMSKSDMKSETTGASKTKSAHKKTAKHKKMVRKAKTPMTEGAMNKEEPKK